MNDMKSKPTRRWGLGALLGLGAAGLGVWWGLRQHAAQVVDGAEVDAFWQAKLARLDGRVQALDAWRGKRLLVNFWATWCPPCVEELPLLSQFHAQHQAAGFQVLGIAVDKQSAVETFLQRQPLSFPVLLAGMEGLHLSQVLGNAANGLPFSVMFGPSGAITAQKIGKLTKDDLEKWLKSG